jgi:type IV fimbrial biogenesis protein FimT
MRHQRGFNLIELIVVLAIVSCLLSLAMGAYGSARAAVVSSDASAALQQSLRDAVRYSAVDAKHVVICASRDGQRCSGAVTWEEGWIMFVDRDRDLAPDLGARLLRQQPAFGADLTIRGTRGRTRIVLQPHGGAASGSNATLTICDRRGVATRVILAGSGRVRTEREDDPMRARCP